MGFLHFHNWQEHIHAVHDKTLAGGKYASGHYRYCDGCGEWQEQIFYYSRDSDWVSCEKPEKSLIHYKEWNNF